MSLTGAPQGSIWQILLGAIVLLVIAWFGLGFVFPEGEARHQFRSPDRAMTFDLSEQCAETGCTRLATLTRGLPDKRETLACAVPLTGPLAQLPNAVVVWSETGTSLDVIHADAAGEGGRFTVDFARDCRPA